MAFSSVPTTLYDVGKAVVNNLFSLLKTNQDDLNTRLSSVEGSTSKRIFFNEPVFGAGNFTTVTGVAQVRVDAALDITEALISIGDEVGAITSGTLEIDIIKATGAGDGGDFSSSVSIFTTKPSINFASASDYDESTNQVINSTNGALVAGDYLQLNVTSKPADLGKFFIYCIAEAS